MIVGIHHTALSTRDADRLVRFYRELFGFEVEFDFPWDESNAAFEQSHAVGKTAGRVVMVSNGSSRLEIFEYRKPAPRPDIGGRANADLGIAHFGIEVRDIEKEYARLSAAGMKFQSPLVTQTPTIKMAYGRDPDGNIIELIDFDASEARSEPTRGFTSGEANGVTTASEARPPEASPRVRRTESRQPGA